MAVPTTRPSPQEFLDPTSAAELLSRVPAGVAPYAAVLDAIDSVAPKVSLLAAGVDAGVLTVSSMGAGGRVDPARVRLVDVADTHTDAFAAAVRRGLRRVGVRRGVTVAWSDEPAAPAALALARGGDNPFKKSYYGTCSYMPALFGLLMASHVLRCALPSDSGASRRQQALKQKQRHQQHQRRGEGETAASRQNTSIQGPLASFNHAAGIGIGLDGSGI